MSFYLTKKEVDACASGLPEEFEELLGQRRLVARPRAKQWAFFRHCFAVLTGTASGDFPCSRQKAIQYKYEVSDRLERYYLTTSNPIHFVFKLVDLDDANLLGMEFLNYPRTNGYLLLVTETTITEKMRAMRAVVESVVTAAIDAEWDVYKKLPQMDVSSLEGIFDPDGSAYKQIYGLASEHSKKSLTISNSMNPSVRRLIKIAVEELSDEAARVRTVEYWRLAWWSIPEKKYVRKYNEENNQQYFLTFRDGKWLVGDNFYPPPKTSPRRWS